MRIVVLREGAPLEAKIARAKVSRRFLLNLASLLRASLDYVIGDTLCRSFEQVPRFVALRISHYSFVQAAYGLLIPLSGTC